MMVKRSGSLSAAMHLRAIEGLSYQEISLVTGCSVKAGWPPSTTQHHHIDESGGGTLLFEGQTPAIPATRVEANLGRSSSRREALLA